jgi:hypothetical protein
MEGVGKCLIDTAYLLGWACSRDVCNKKSVEYVG